MENKIFNKTNLIVFLLVVLVTLVLAWLILPKMVTVTVPQEHKHEHKHEHEMEQEMRHEMEQEMRHEMEHEMKQEHFDNEGMPQEAKAEDKNLPYVNPKTGSLMDGPGFERGDVEGVAQESMSTIPSNYYFLDDGNGGNDSIQHNLCSKSCCSAQWPTPFKQKYDSYVCQNKDQFVPSQIMCNNSFQDSGCLCLTKKQSQNLYMRGGNGREWF